MHSISLYHLRAYNPNRKYSDGTHYAPLDDANGKDLVTIFKDYVNSLVKKDFKRYEDEKSVLSFMPFHESALGRCVWGVVNTGNYGVKGAIRDAATGDLKYSKDPGDADIKERFYLLFSPSGKNEAIVVLHGISGDGIKSLLYKDLGQIFRKETGLTLQFNPVTYEKAVQQWMDADVKAVKAVGFLPYSDKTDVLKGMGHKHAELILKPKRKGTFGKLEKFRKGQRSDAVEFLETHCKDLKAVVEMDGKKRVFRIGGTRQNPVFKLDLDDCVTVDDGVPDFEQMYDWVVEVIDELCIHVYPGQKVKLCPVR